MSEKDSDKGKPRMEIDVSDLTPEQIRQLVDSIYAEVPDVVFTPEARNPDGVPPHDIELGYLRDIFRALNASTTVSQQQSPQTQTQERTHTQIQYPVRYKVVFLNDDFTPMDFVIQLLVEIFNKTLDQAHDITMEIHNTSSGIAGVYSLEIAEQKTHEALVLCKHAGHPLEIIYEPV